MLLLSLVLLLYPIVIIGGAGLWSFSRTLKENFQFYTDKELSLLTSLVPNKLEEIRETMLNTLYGQEVHQLKRIDDPLQRERQVQSYIRSTVRNHPAVGRVILVYFYGQQREIYSSQAEGLLRNPYNPPEAYALEILVERIRFGLQEGDDLDYFYYIDNARDSRVYMASNIYQLSDHYIQSGILIFEIQKEYLFNQFQPLVGDPLKELLIFDPGGKVLWQQGQDIQGDYLPWGQPVWTLDFPALPEGVSYRDGYYLIRRNIPQVQWTVLAQSSPDQLLGVMRWVSFQMFLICILSIPFFLIVVLLFHRNMIKPLQDLALVMGKVERGQWGETLSLKRKDEIGRLVSSFNRMSLRIAQLVRTVYEEEIELQNAQIKALQTQMNPHFLFNTLEAINWRAILEEQEEISQMIQALASITSASIDRDNQRFVSLAQEKEYIQSYLLLLQKRFGEKLEVELDIPSVLEGYRLPRLILQPLVENAVVHGIEQEGQGRLKIKVEKDDAYLRIFVEDHGPGMAPDKLKELQELLATEPQSTGASKSVALVNVHKRLRLIYNGDFQFLLSSLEGRGTMASIRIPMEKMDKEDGLCSEFY